jgi:uncharacterized protein (TIGR02594 family)
MGRLFCRTVGAVPQRSHPPAAGTSSDLGPRHMKSPLDQPPWLARAWAELGQHETPGASANPRIRALFADAGHPGIASDETAWCAAFAGACLRRAGQTPTGSLLARSYLAWGVESAPRLGAIAVLSRGGDPALGHTGFLIGEASDSLILLGGNQHDSVSVAAFPKSRLLSLRWPAGPASVHFDDLPSRSGADFEAALAHVLDMEGGYTNDPADPGGPTNFGITLADYARFRQIPIAAATRADLIASLQHIAPDAVRAIYLARYWTPAGCPLLPAPLAFFHFDTAVNMGTGTAIRMLQTALGCTIDGEIGPQTRATASAADPRALLTAYADLRRRRYRSLASYPRFGRGWLARVDTTLAHSLALISTATPTQGPRPMTAEQPTQASAEPKWWGHSLTIWGAVVTGLAAVLPALGPAIGVDITPQAVKTSADQITVIAQAATGLAGTIAVIIGRLRAKQPLQQRTLTLKV